MGKYLDPYIKGLLLDCIWGMRFRGLVEPVISNTEGPLGRSEQHMSVVLFRGFF